MIVEKQFISAEDFWEVMQQPEYADRMVELVEGEIVDMPLPNPIHAAVLGTLSAAIFNHVHGRRLGRVLIGDVPFVLERNPEGKDTLRGIDIAFVSTERLSGRLPRKPLTVAPDLAVEVISPSNKAEDIENKTQQLLKAGTELIWIVYPELQSVTVHSADGSVKLSEPDILTGGKVLPDFAIPVREIFADA